MSKWAESEFREFLRARLMNDPNEVRQTAFVAKLAAMMGMSTFSLYDILSGRIDLGFDRLPALVNALREVKGSGRISGTILSWIVSRCRGFAVVELVARVTDGRIDGEIDDVMVISGELFADKVQALRDGELDEDERQKIYDVGIRLRSKLDALLAELTEMKARAGGERG